MNPYMTASEAACKSACEGYEYCDAIILLADTPGQCWLRQNFVLGECVKSNRYRVLVLQRPDTQPDSRWAEETDFK